MPYISKEEVEKVATLARLSLSENEIKQYSKQLEEILDYINQLGSVDTENIIPTTRAVEVTNVVRRDEVQISSEQELLINLAPQREGKFYKVPKIMSD
tara:strand:- start:591 stop:884 length:294 start_codon:yes stop_codon:yes gene_type:complete